MCGKELNDVLKTIMKKGSTTKVKKVVETNDIVDKENPILTDEEAKQLKKAVLEMAKNKYGVK